VLRRPINSLFKKRNPETNFGSRARPVPWGGKKGGGGVGGGGKKKTTKGKREKKKSKPKKKKGVKKNQKNPTKKVKSQKKKGTLGGGNPPNTKFFLGQWGKPTPHPQVKETGGGGGGGGSFLGSFWDHKKIILPHNIGQKNIGSTGNRPPPPLLWGKTKTTLEVLGGKKTILARLYPVVIIVQKIKNRQTQKTQHQTKQKPTKKNKPTQKKKKQKEYIRSRLKAGHRYEGQNYYRAKKTISSPT